MVSLFPSMKGYQRSWLARDVVAGVTIAAIAVPGQIAVAKVAGMPPTTGLWVAIAAGIVALVFVASRQLWMGSDSTTAPLIFAGLSVMAVPGSDQYVRLAVTLAILVGVFVCIVAFAKMLWIAELLSRTVVTGFMSGVAVIIIVGQIPSLLGIPAGGTHTLQKIWHILTNLGEINWAAATIGVVSLVALPVFAHINKKLPGALLVVTLATLATALLSLKRFDIEVLGPLDGGLPHPVWPDFSIDALRGVLPTALAIALLAIAQTAATSRTNADANGEQANLKDDFTGLGIANLASAGTGSYSVNGSPGATAVMASSGARSQLGAAIGSLVLLVIVLFATGLVADLPMATLAAIMIMLSARIVNITELKRIRRYSGSAFALSLGTFAAVVVLGVESGVLIAVTVSLIARAVQASRPELTQLGRRSDGHWLPIDEPHAHHHDGILVLSLNGPVWFANANWFHDQILAHLDANPDTRGLIINTVAIDDLDYTGASVLKDVVILVQARGVQVAVVHVVGRADESMQRIRLTSKLADHRLFQSVEDAYQDLATTLSAKPQ